MKIEIEFDVFAFEKGADVFVERSIAPAIVDGLNAAANAGRLAVIEAMPSYLDRPNPFTMMGVGMFQATVNNASGKDPAAYVRINPEQAEYLRYQILGGDRAPGDFATTSQGPLVPGPDAELDAYGNLPRDYVQQQMGDPNVAWVQLRPGQPPALVRTVGGRMEILALIVHELHYDQPKLPFYDLVTAAATATFPGAFGAALSARTRG